MPIAQITPLTMGIRDCVCDVFNVCAASSERKINIKWNERREKFYAKQYAQSGKRLFC